MKIPKQLFITAKNSSYYDSTKNESIPEILGFLHPHDTTKADAKRKKTQLDWAYGDWYILEGKYRHKGRRWDIENGGQNVIVWDKQIDDSVYPKIWDNVPLSGFRILRSVSRHSTSNKLWRILDPRGIVFEISTGCLEEILLEGSVINGIIQGECVWIGNKNLKLIPNNTV